MRDGFIRVACATPSIRVADCIFNAQAIAQLMESAAEKEARILVLPELSLSGYTCGDLFSQDILLQGALEGLDILLAKSRGLPLLTAVGMPLEVGGKLYNCAVFLYRGRVLGVVPKTHLPNYGEFYERRQFTPAPQEMQEIELLSQRCPFGTRILLDCSNFPGLRIGAEICEDLWAPCPPSIAHALAGATVILNLSASDETVGKQGYRRDLVCGQSARLVCGYLYAGAGEGESTTDLVFPGCRMVAENGAMLSEGEPFTTGVTYTELDIARLLFERRRLTTFVPAPAEGYCVVPFSLEIAQTKLSRHFSPRPFVPDTTLDRDSRCEEILRLQAAGLQKRIEHTGCRSLVLGLSGGLDSTLALLVAARAVDSLSLGREKILAVTMPCFGTTSRTRQNAEKLAAEMGVSLRRIDLAVSVTQHLQDIGHPEGVYDATYENAQARERTQVLMDLANQTGGLVVGTGDLSELALGWATYNGDHMSMYAVNASVPKTLVRHLVRYAADQCTQELRAVLLDILDTPVSPELLPAKEGEMVQQTEELVGPYDLHDFFLYYAIRWGFPPRKVYRLGCQAFAGQFSKEEILRWLKVFYRRFFSQQFKRSCLPDGPKVGSVTLSPRGDWRMPSDACSALWLRQAEELSPL